MSEKTDARPTQATLGGALVVSGSVFLVVSLFSTVGGLRSLETRRQVEEFLAEPPVAGWGLGVEQVLTGLYVSSLVAGGCAAAMAVLGVYALRRHRQARVGLAVLAVPLMVTGLVSGGFLASMVAVAVVLLWTQPARDWYAGRQRTVPSVPSEPSEAASPSTEAPSEGPGSPSAPARPGETSTARAYQGFGDPSAATSTGTMPRPWGQQERPTRRAAEGPRPAPLVVACVLTWVTTGLALLLVAAAVVELVAAPEVLMEQARRQQPDLEAQGITESMLVGATAGFMAVIALWAVAAGVLAAYAFRGANGARIALLVSAGVSGALLFLASFAAYPLFLPAAAAVTAFVCLLRSDVVAWTTSSTSPSR